MANITMANTAMCFETVKVKNNDVHDTVKPPNSVHPKERTCRE